MNPVLSTRWQSTDHGDGHVLGVMMGMVILLVLHDRRQAVIRQES